MNRPGGGASHAGSGWREARVTGTQRLPGDGCADWAGLIRTRLVPRKERSAGHHGGGHELPAFSWPTQPSRRLPSAHLAPSPSEWVSAAWTDFLPVLGQPRTPGSARQVLARGPLRCRASLLASGQGLSHVSLTETLRLSFLLRHRRKRPASRREWGALCFLEEAVGWSSFSLQ